MKKVIFTEKAPAAIGPYSQAIEANGMVFLSGQIPVDPATGEFVQGEDRLIENIVLQSGLCEMPVVGFENHGGRTYINDNMPFGKVLYGAGNDGKSGYEGVVYKNVIGTYLHGPLLPKNPQICDWLISKALERKYGSVELIGLDDGQEKEANAYICGRYVK